MCVIFRTYCLLSSLLLAGCVASTTVIGKPGDPIASDAVTVYYIEPPRCDFDTVAHLQVRGGYFTLDSLLRHMRREAAELGASGLYVQWTEQSEMREFGGSARAIRCRSV